MNIYKKDNIEIHYTTLGQKDDPIVIWAHGWGQDHEAFIPLASSLERLGHHHLLDLPGFGQSPMPADVWSTADYADAAADFIKDQTDKKVTWVGHSFGCRVGLQLAARHPDLLKGLFLIAGAGLKKQRPLHRKASLVTFKIYLYKALKKLTPLGLINEEWLKSKFGSADYKSAGAMRDILVKTVNEDLTEVAKTITCPVKLVYGTQDTETPVEIGQRLNTLIKDSDLVTLEGQDHYSVLGSGRHQVAPLLKKFIEDVN